MEEQFGIRRLFTSTSPASSFSYSPDEKSLLLRCPDGHFEVLDSKSGVSIGFFPKEVEPTFRVVDYAPLSSELMGRFGKGVFWTASGPLAFFKLPSSQSAFVEKVVGQNTFLNVFAWTKDKAFLAIESNGGGYSYSWPALDGGYGAEVPPPYRDETGELRTRSLHAGEAPDPASNDTTVHASLRSYDAFLSYTEKVTNPFRSEDRPKVSVESGDGRFRLQFLGKAYAASREDSMAAVPIVQVHPPGDVRRFIEPFLGWYERPDELIMLIALRDDLHAELLDKATNPALPQEWRDLLLWWTSKPGERKPLYQ